VSKKDEYFDDDESFKKFYKRNVNKDNKFWEKRKRDKKNKIKESRECKNKRFD
jgi:hypothetical protein